MRRQIYAKILLVQRQRAQFRTDNFQVYSRQCQINHIDTNDDIYAKAIMITAMQNLYTSMKELRSKRTLNVIEDMTIDLRPLFEDMTPRVFTRATKQLEAEGFLIKLGYKGYKYIVNPFDYNRLDGEQCAYLRDKLREAD